MCCCLYCFSERYDMGNGGYMELEWADDGSSLFCVYNIPCMMCGGTGVCNLCMGYGVYIPPFYATSSYPCNMCGRSGRCNVCNGTGRYVQRMATSYNTTITIDNTGNAMYGPGFGLGIAQQNARMFGGGNSDSNNDYIEVIEYAPNYTGQDNSEYCNKCKKIMSKHVHIKKRQ